MATIINVLYIVSFLLLLLISLVIKSIIDYWIFGYYTKPNQDAYWALMGYSNLDGIDPRKLSKDELFSMIDNFQDLPLICDCVDYMIEIDPSAVLDKIESVLITNVQSDNYPDHYYQQYYLNILFSYRPKSAITYCLANYVKVESRILEAMVNEVQEGEEYEVLKDTLIEYLKDKKDIFKGLDEIIDGINTSREDFLKAFGCDEQVLT